MPQPGSQPPSLAFGRDSKEGRSEAAFLWEREARGVASLEAIGQGSGRWEKWSVLAGEYPMGLVRVRLWLSLVGAKLESGMTTGLGCQLLSESWLFGAV